MGLLPTRALHEGTHVLSLQDPRSMGFRSTEQEDNGRDDRYSKGAAYLGEGRLLSSVHLR